MEVQLSVEEIKSGKSGASPGTKKRARRLAIPATPTIVKREVPRRGPNADYRSRESLSAKEVGEVIAAAATQGRHGLRDSALILIAYRHGLRVSEL